MNVMIFPPAYEILCTLHLSIFVMSQQSSVALVWFRHDLRVHDNPALAQACTHDAVIPLFIHDTDNTRPIGSASRAWLDCSLESLNTSLNNCLHVATGSPMDIINQICQTHNVQSVYWNRYYTPYALKRDEQIESFLSHKGYTVQTFNGSLLWEPWTIQKNDGTPYKVFTPFYRKGCLQGPEPRSLCTLPPDTQWVAPSGKHTVHAHVDHTIRTRHASRLQHWSIGENSALKRFHAFIESGLSQYKEGRNFPAQDNVSRLSPHLHFGELSPHTIWHTLKDQASDRHVDHFLSEIGWREFSYTLLYYNPTMDKDNIQEKFDRFPWQNNADHLRQWQEGKTGIPMVDAGMRELSETGYIHNRSRMIVASFLVKNLTIHWHYGEQWFWDTLFDADMANNCAGWQWVAGSGADAAPYFRIFNPISQGEKFDPDGIYIRRYVTELADMPLKHIFEPWTSPHHDPHHYPKPMISLAQSRQDALNAFKSL
jgi:deoxyribodipyrimidine photo-lyase